MDVHTLSESEFGEWDNFVEQSEGGSVFHQAWWHRAWATDFKILALRGEGGQLNAGVPLCFTQLFGESAIGTPPLSPYGGPLVGGLPGTSRAADRKRTARRLSSLVDSCPMADVIQWVMSPSAVAESVFRWRGFECQICYTFLAPQLQVDIWRDHLSKRHRRNLEGAEVETAQADMSIDFNGSLDEAWPLFEQTAGHKGFTLPDHSRSLSWWEVVEERGAGSIAVMRAPGGDPVAAGLSVWDSKTTYYLMGGMSHQCRSQSGWFGLLLARMIEDSHRSGRDFDFEAATFKGLANIDAGLERSFMRWGAVERPLCRFLRILSVECFRRLKHEEVIEPLIEMGLISSKGAVQATVRVGEDPGSSLL